VSDRLLTAREVGDWLGLSPASVLRRWRAGQLPGFRLSSNVVRFDRDEVERWLLDTRRCSLESQQRPLRPVE
jgi:predicted DNA-binding transcriptional regulator AlpA